MAAALETAAGILATCTATVAKIKRCAIRQGDVVASLELVRAMGAQPLQLDDRLITVKRGDFITILERFGIKLNDLEVKSLFSWLDRSAEGFFSVSEFASSLRHIADPQRRSLVRRAYLGLPKDGSTSRVPLTKALATLNFNAHPRVRMGAVDAATVATAHKDMFSPARFPDGSCSWSEFELILAGVSASMDSNSHFAAYMLGVWRIPGVHSSVIDEFLQSPEDPNVSMTSSSGFEAKADRLRRLALKQALDVSIEEHARVVLSNPGGSRAVGCALRAEDPNHTGFLPLSVFLDKLSTLRLYFPAPDLPHTFLGVKVTGGDVQIDYLTYLCALNGTLPAPRQAAVDSAWFAMAGTLSSVTIHQVISRFKGSVVESGSGGTRKGASMSSGVSNNAAGLKGDEVSQFFDAWDERRAPSARVDYFEFEEWFFPVSKQSKTDAAFLQQIERQWGF